MRVVSDGAFPRLSLPLSSSDPEAVRAQSVLLIIIAIHERYISNRSAPLYLGLISKGTGERRDAGAL